MGILKLRNQMFQPKQTMVEETMSQLESIMGTPVGTTAMAEIDKEVIPILTLIMKLRPENGTIETSPHPGDNYLLEWLINPKRSADEFNYVVGPLSKHVFKLKKEEFYPQPGDESYQQPSSIYHKYLFIVATKSLTVRCPILEGPWEHAVWLVLRLFKYFADECRISYINSDILTKWIIYVIRDTNICPNPYLRLELMYLFKNSYISNHNQSEILESVMLAVSSLDINYLDRLYYGEFSMINFKNVLEIFQLFMGDVTLLYSHRLAIKLKGVKNIRLSSFLNDVAFQCSKNPSKYNEPDEFNCVTLLIKTITEYVRLKLKESEEQGRNFHSDSRLDKLQSVGALFWILIYHLKECLVMPQLISLTASFVMEVLEFVCLTSRGLFDEESQLASKPYLQDIRKVNYMLKDLCDEQGFADILDSPLGREIWDKYSKRLKSLRTRLMNISIFSHIHALIYYDQLLETGIATLPHMFDMRW